MCFCMPARRSRKLLSPPARNRRVKASRLVTLARAFATKTNIVVVVLVLFFNTCITKTSVGFRYTCMCWFSLYVLVFVMHVLYMSGTCLRVRGNQVLYMCYTFQGNELLP